MAFVSIGLLHPGDMGAGIGAALVGAGYSVAWASEGRGAASSRRAAGAGLVDVHSVGAMVERCDLIVSVCPPSAALDVSKSVAGFRGTYLDANAIAPETAREVAAVIAGWALCRRRHHRCPAHCHPFDPPLSFGPQGRCGS
jgi:3-hydroxyisobutyrate dehydrogenase-like beta-hydroxyacid dehydrogenase